MNKKISGTEFLARGAIEVGVSLITGYPGSPITGVVNWILAHTSPETVHVDWNSNEKVAIEMAFGASVGGKRTLLCVKSVGMNIALDPLMALNLSGCNAGMVILLGDDPGGWGSQNEQDSRSLARMAEIPLLEPTSVSHARSVMQDAFSLSEEIGVPVIVRITRALALAEAVPLPADNGSAGVLPAHGPQARPPTFAREFMRWVVLPINVMPYHQRLLERLDQVQQRFERAAHNGVEGEGPYGVITSGFTYQKLKDLLGTPLPSELKIFRLGTFHPLPGAQLTAFLRSVTSVLVLEENAPLVERGVRSLAQMAALTLPICGRDTGHIPLVGELFAPHLAKALNSFVPDLMLSTEGPSERSRPSRQPLCEGCPYIPLFDALLAVMQSKGGRDAFIITGDPGCMVRAQLPPYKLLDVKNSLGSSIGTAAGIALSQRGAPAPKRVIALSGDSSFLHSGFFGLVDAVRLAEPLLVLILDNGTTALSGRQPHPAVSVDARGTPRPAVDLAALAESAGAGLVRVVDLDRGDDIQQAITSGLSFGGVAVLVARGHCVRD